MRIGSGIIRGLGFVIFGAIGTVGALRGITVIPEGGGGGPVFDAPDNTTSPLLMPFKEEEEEN
jgi:hypothetical protein